MKRFVCLLFSAALLLSIGCSALAYDYDSYEEDLFSWQNIVRCDYFDADWPYLIAREGGGKMHICNPVSDFYNMNFVKEVRSLKNVKEYTAFLSYDMGYSLCVVAVNNDGTVNVCTSAESPSDDVLRIMFEASRLKAVKNVAVLTGYNGEMYSLLAVHTDGTVSVCGRAVDSRILSWSNIKQLYTFKTDNVIGLKNDGTCVASGDAFEGMMPPSNCVEIFYPESWTNVKDICVATCPWGTELYVLKNDGTVIQNNRNLILYDISSLYYDKESCHIYAIGTDGTGYMYCSEGCQAPRRKDLVSVGPSGIAVDRQGRILQEGYGFGIYDRFYGSPLNNVAMRSVNTCYTGSCYFGISKDGRIRLVELNRY